MILLSISPFIFIQCGSGGGEVGGPGLKIILLSSPPYFFFPGGRGFLCVGRRFHTGKAHRGSAVRPFRSI